MVIGFVFFWVLLNFDFKSNCLPAGIPICIITGCQDLDLDLVCLSLGLFLYRNYTVICNRDSLAAGHLSVDQSSLASFGEFQILGYRYSALLFSKLSIIIAIPLLCFAEFTDYLDGHYARKHNEVSDFGKLFDPFADVVVHLGTFLCFMFSFNSENNIELII